jgi:hypothetical protein
VLPKPPPLPRPLLPPPLLLLLLLLLLPLLLLLLPPLPPLLLPLPVLLLLLLESWCLGAHVRGCFPVRGYHLSCPTSPLHAVCKAGRHSPAQRRLHNSMGRLAQCTTPPRSRARPALPCLFSFSYRLCT